MAKEKKFGAVLLPGWVCSRCGHEWRARKPGRPGVCPKCKNYKWDQPREDSARKKPTRKK